MTWFLDKEFLEKLIAQGESPYPNGKVNLGMTTVSSK